MLVQSLEEPASGANVPSPTAPPGPTAAASVSRPSAASIAASNRARRRVVLAGAANGIRAGLTIGGRGPLHDIHRRFGRLRLPPENCGFAKSVKNAQQAYDRAQALLKTAAGTQKALEDAEAALRTSQARLNSSQTRLTRRKMASPVTGSVEQVYFRPGEMVPAGKPVLALLPPGNLKVRFFVSEALLPQIKIGETVTITCDGCAANLAAKVSFIARQSEFTPPVIYSLDERSKLVFLIEARPERPEALRVGQPMSVALKEPPR